MGLEGFALRDETFGLCLGIVIRSVQYGSFWGYGSATRDTSDIPIRSMKPVPSHPSLGPRLG